MAEQCKQCGAEAQITLHLCRRCHGEWLMDSEEAVRQVDLRKEMLVALRKAFTDLSAVYAAGAKPSYDTIRKVEAAIRKAECGGGLN